MARRVVGLVLKRAGVTALAAAGISMTMKLFMPITRWRMRKIPGTRQKPLVGDGLQMLKQDTTPFLDNLCKSYSDTPLVKFWFMSEPSVVVRDARVALEVLKTLDTRYEYNPIPWLPAYERAPWDHLLLFSNGEKWAKHRRATEESVMHTAALNEHIPSLKACTEKLMAVLETYAAAKGPVNVQPGCIAMAEDAITQAIFGFDMHTSVEMCKPGDTVCLLRTAASALAVGNKAYDTSLLTPEQIENGWWDKYPLGSPEFGRRFVASAVGIMSMAWTKLPLAQGLCLAMPRLTPLWRILAAVLPDKNTRLQKKLVKGVHASCLKMVASWKAENQEAAAKGNSTRKPGMLPYVLSKSSQAGNDKFSDDEVLGLSINALFGGYDSTGNSLTMCMYYLARNPEVQKKAQQEVDQALSGKAPESKDLNNLSYINAIMNEVLRLASPGASAGRYTLKEYTHPDGSFKIPKGVVVWFALHTYHRDPSIWPRPDDFLPERFIPGHEDLAPADAGLFMPFGAGARRCPGYKFAMLEGRLALARILQRFEFSTTDDCPEPVMRTSIVYMANNVYLKVAHRPAPAAA